MPPTQKFIQSIVDAHPDPFALIDCDHTIVACNQQYAEAYTHLAPADIVGMKCHEVSHKSANTCEINGEECPLKRVFDAAQPIQVIHRHFDRQNNPEYVAIHGSPILNDDGTPLYMGESMRSITQEQDLVFDEQKMVGCCPSFMHVLDNLCLVAETDAPALINGETGTGKEMAAKLLHRKSPRVHGNFVTIDCTTFTEEMLGNELFGHEAGAFTGCVGVKKGLIELAHQGTLFMDEIGEIPLSIQVKLLRVLETGSFRRLGSVQERKTDFRLIAATNRDLKQMVEQGSFRADLYYRINCMQIELPPLRHRVDDIPELARHFLSRKIMGIQVSEISPEALNALRQYSFPGNMRELRNILERAALLARGKIIKLEHLPDDLRKISSSTEITATSAAQMHGVFCQHDTVLSNDFVLHTLQRFGQNRKKAAAFLKISERTLYRRIKQLQFTDR
jgi:transcriptional regulator with PAS, ATPase and Fis domain